MWLEEYLEKRHVEMPDELEGMSDIIDAEWSEPDGDLPEGMYDRLAEDLKALRVLEDF
jgi:hypothetical protein